MKKRIYAFLLVFIMLASLFPALAFAAAKPTISNDSEIIGGSSADASSTIVSTSTDASNTIVSASDSPNLVTLSWSCSSSVIYFYFTNDGDPLDLITGTITATGGNQKTFSFVNVPSGFSEYIAYFNMLLCSENISISWTGYDGGVPGTTAVSTGHRDVPTNEINAWSYGGEPTKQKNIEKHFIRHGMQTGNLDIRAYILDAISFRSNFSPSATGTPVSGITSNVYRFRQGNYYIDLERPNSFTNLIVSYGTR